MSNHRIASRDKIIDFGERLRESRIAAGLSVRELEALTEKEGGLRVSIANISMIETGRRASTFDMAYVLAKVLSIPTDIALEATLNSRIAHSAKREVRALRAFTSSKRLGRKIDVEAMADRLPFATG